MARYLGLEHDLLIFTDSDQVAGGAAWPDGHAVMLTRGTVLTLRGALFPASGGTTSITDDALAALVVRDFPGLTESDAARAVEHLVESVPGLVLGDAETAAGPVQTEQRPDAGTVELDGVPMPVPAGTLQSRALGGHTVVLSVGAQSLAGTVRPNPTLAVVDRQPNGVAVKALIPEPTGATTVHEQLHPGGVPGGGPVPHPHPTPNPKPHPKPPEHCGVCGTCGVCGLCGEINYGAAATAVAELTHLSLTARDLQRSRSENIVAGSSRLDALNEAAQPLLRLANEDDPA